MTLLTASGEVPDRFRRVETVEGAWEGTGAPLVPLALLPAFLEHAEGEEAFALSVPNDTAVEEIVPHLSRLALVAVEFPAFSDGRGLSLARRLRRAGFSGTLRASGPLIADQFAEALACGFDEVELPDTMANRQPVQQWMAAKEAMSVHYQRGYGETRSILEERRAARREGRT